MLDAKHLDHFYGESHTLWEVDLEISNGERLCLMGRNGVGKTTLLKCIMGLENPSSGQLNFNGQDLTRLSCEERARAGIAYVPQGREIFPRLTVEENLKVGLGAVPGEKRIPSLIFDLFPVLNEMLGRRGGDLSGGQQQQLAIGRAITMRPRLLILDEPTEGIQPSIIKDIGRAINVLRGRGDISIVLVEQFFEFAWELADHVVVLDRGQVRLSGDKVNVDRKTAAELVSI